MKLIANGINGNYLRDCIPEVSVELDGVLAAVAYGSDSNNPENLLDDCLRRKCRLDIWMRYDHTVPVAVPLLRRLLSGASQNIFCRLIPDCMHSKVIWWRGHGAYIGSANLTDRAWITNIEAGLFISQAELEETGIAIALELFFTQLRRLPDAFNLTTQIVREMEELAKLRAGVDKTGMDRRSVPYSDGIAMIDSRVAFERHRDAFGKEWHQTESYLRMIGNALASSRPTWIDADVPIAWQTDQFLHSYYYNRVGDGRERPYQEYYDRNHADPRGALERELDWWRSTANAPSGEDRTFTHNAPRIQELLRPGHAQKIGEAELSEICALTHATRDHVSKMRLSAMGVDGVESMGRDDRLMAFGRWLHRQRNDKGWSVGELLAYVLHGGSDADMWSRIFSASRDSTYSFPHYGLNSIAEVAGWARPDAAFPRNGRTSKALTALGFDVQIY